MGSTFTLTNTSFAASISGGLNEGFNGATYGFGSSYSFAPSALANGTGIGKAQLSLSNGQLQLTAIANPAAAPSLSTATTTGTIVAGTYTFQYTYYNSSGETIGSATATIVVPNTTATNTITITAPGLPAGATGINVYITAGGTGTGKVGTAASNIVTLTAPPAPTGSLPSATLSTATIVGSIDLTAIQTPSKQFDFSGADHTGTGGSGPSTGAGTGGVKNFWMENTDTTVGQVITFLSPANLWTNGLGTGTHRPMGPGPSAAGFFDALGILVTATNKIVQVQAKYNTPLINFAIIGEGSWF